MKPHPKKLYIGIDIGGTKLLAALVQVNGKIRGRIRIARSAGEDDVRTAALADENVRKFIEGKSIKKLIYVPGRVLNFIVG